MRRCLLLVCSALVAISANARTIHPSSMVGAANPSPATSAIGVPASMAIAAVTMDHLNVHLIPSLANVHVLHFTLRLTAPTLIQEGAAKPLSLPDAPSLSRMLDLLPVGTHLRRIGHAHLNTEDSSVGDDFAICYRVNHRWGFQVIPGDPAPVKLPVSSFENSEGVTVGMVMRLSR